MVKILKYMCNMDEPTPVRASKILTFQMQDGVPCVWAEVGVDGEYDINVEYEVIVLGTGFEVPKDEGFEYISTAMQGQYVWHAYFQEVK